MIRTGDVRILARAFMQDLTNTLIAENRDRVQAQFSLDESQKQVVKSQAKFMRVVAPAGSGKTQTLTAKAGNVLANNPNARILCLTFTNAAANEIQDRIVQKIPSSSNLPIKVSTLNAFGYDLLRSINPSLQIASSNGRGLGRAINLTKTMMVESNVWQDRRDNSRLCSPILELTNMMKSLGFNHQHDIEDLQSHYALVKALGMSQLIEKLVEDIGINGDFNNVFINLWMPFWKRLSDKLWESNLITLEDQKYWAMTQLASNDKSQSWLRIQQFSHVFVDEFQDINLLDLFLVSQIVHLSNASLVIVGDDDQCIYEWRGCTSIFIQKPEMSFGQILYGNNFETITLEKNYRCPQNIVTHSEKLISHNISRIPKRMIPVNEESANIRVVSVPAAYITLNVVDELIANIARKYPNHTVAVVGRKKCQLIPIQILLTKREIKFAIDKDLNVFAGDAFKDFRHFLSLPSIYTQSRSIRENVADMMALLKRVQRTPVSQVERQEIEQWLMQHQPESLQSAVDKFGYYLGQFKRGRVNTRDVSIRLKSFLEKSSVVACVKVASEVFIGFQKDFVRSRDDIFYSDPPFSHLADLAVNYEGDFQSFLQDIDRAIERSTSSNSREARIELMTALRTKGREFDTVIVLDVNDGIFPNKMAKDAGRIEEERRLFYVTVTRTKNNLLLFDSGRIQGQSMNISPFINEMDLPDSSRLSHPQVDRISRELLDQLRV